MIRPPAGTAISAARRIALLFIAAQRLPDRAPGSRALSGTVRGKSRFRFDDERRSRRDFDFGIEADRSFFRLPADRLSVERGRNDPVGPVEFESAQAERAAEIAKAVSGVKSVRNDLSVK